jgi:hypothetical protein
MFNLVQPALDHAPSILLFKSCKAITVFVSLPVGICAFEWSWSITAILSMVITPRGFSCYGNINQMYTIWLTNQLRSQNSG